MTTGRIDAHHHFWRYSPAEYGWINDQMQLLRRDFLPADLKPLLNRAGVKGAIAVQARQTLEETRWLLSLAEDETSDATWMKGVVGWAPIAAADFQEVLADLQQNKKLKGCATSSRMNRITNLFSMTHSIVVSMRCKIRGSFTTS